MNDRPTECEVLIVGAGPGGLAAAISAAERGSHVAIVDEGAFAGGQIWRNLGHAPEGDSQARQWLARFDAIAPRVAWFKQSRVVALPSINRALLETPDGPRQLRWRTMVLATGARELFLPFPGWTLPGVVGAGGMQALVKQGLSVRGKRIVVAGTGPLLLAVAALLRGCGAKVPLILEQASAWSINRFGLSLVKTPAKLIAGIGLRVRLLGTRYATDGYATGVSSSETGLRVDYVRGGRRSQIDCDYLACGFNLVPNLELPRLIGCAVNAEGFVETDDHQRTTVQNVLAVGELTGIGGVDKALLEGRIAGAVAAGRQGEAARLLRRRAAAMAFARRLASAFALREQVRQLARPDTTICRCEDVPLHAVRHALSGRDAKLQTRCGMGPCQGRVCGPVLEQLCGAEPPGVRPPVFATTIQTLAATPPDDTPAASA